MGSAASATGKPQSPYHRLCLAKVKKAKAIRYIEGEVSDFYILCSNGEMDRVREILETPHRVPIDDLIKLERNGNTALHVATEKGHTEVVKLLLEHKCSRTIINRFGKIAAEEATTPEIQKLFSRSDSGDRFHEFETAKTMTAFLPAKNGSDTTNNEAETIVSEALDFIQRFKSEKETQEYSLNQQTTAMWLRFYTWFSHTFPSLFQRDNVHIDAFDLHKNSDFKHFLEKKLSEPEKCEETLEAIRKAQETNSIEPLITIYTSESAGFYRSLNRQLADSPAEADNSPHLCDRFIIEFHIRSDELEHRAFTGFVYRGASVSLNELFMYENICKSKPRGVIAFKAFTSTSEDKNISLDFIMNNPPKSHQIAVLFVIEIKVKSPTIMGIADLSVYDYEKEVLVMPGNLFIVKKVVKDIVTPTIGSKTVTLTEIHLEYLHIPVSFWRKLLHTIRSAKNTVT